MSSSASCLESVRTKDTGTLAYEIYFDSDFTECIVLERDRDSAALLEHFANLGSLTHEMFEGNPSPELVKALDGSGVRSITPYSSK